MVKRMSLSVIIITLLGNFEVYPFWIWSPHTKRWKNPQISPLSASKSQMELAFSFWKEKNFKRAFKEFKKIISYYPTSKEAPIAQYYLGRCLEELNKPYQAFEEYQKLIESYPNSNHLQEAISRQYSIGEYFMNKKEKKWLGIPQYDLVEHPSISIFEKIVESSPYCKFAPSAQYKLGILFLRLKRYKEAKQAFKKLIDSYPTSEWIEEAKYELAVCQAEVSLKEDYDQTATEEAIRKLEEFLQEYPDKEISPEVRKLLNKLKEKKAKSEFLIAQFYEKQKKYKSAIFYYTSIIKNFAGTEYSKKAKNRLKQLKK